MWSNIFNLFTRLLTRISKKDNNETWVFLEMRHKTNLENLEYLKKLRIKNF
jgi:hypothetical protein